jgi:hypothetical protein
MRREGNSNCQTGKLEPVKAVVHLAHLKRNIMGALRLELHTLQVPPKCTITEYL